MLCSKDNNPEPDQSLFLMFSNATNALVYTVNLKLQFKFTVYTQAIADLELKRALVVTPEADGYWLRKDVQVCSVQNVWTILREVGVLAT